MNVTYTNLGIVIRFWDLKLEIAFIMLKSFNLNKKVNKF